MADELKSTRERLSVCEKEIEDLKKVVVELCKGAQRVAEEIADEWGAATYPEGEYLGTKIEY